MAIPMGVGAKGLGFVPHVPFEIVAEGPKEIAEKVLPSDFLAGFLDRIKGPQIETGALGIVVGRDAAFGDDDRRAKSVMGL